MSTNNQLQQMITDGKTEEALRVVDGVWDYHDAEANADTVLRMKQATPELIDAALEAFVNTRSDQRPEHGYWVHSLSHFTQILWERRLVFWIQKLNLVAFTGANELMDDNCSSRLVSDFASYALWSDDPADFHLTPELIGWMDWEYCQYAQARIEVGRFDTEADCLRWQLGQPKAYTERDFDAQTDLISVNKLRAIFQRLQELGAEISEFSNLEKELLTRQLGELEGKLAAAKADWQRERAEKGIQKTHAALDQLG